MAIYNVITGKAGALGSVSTALAAAYLDLQVQRVLTIGDFYGYIFGDPAWLRSTPAETAAHQAWLSALLAAAADGSDGGAAITPAEEANLRAMPLAAHLTPGHVTLLLERWNRSVAYWAQGIQDLADVPPGQSTDFIARDVYNAKALAAAAAMEAATDEGFVDWGDGIALAVQTLEDALENPSEGICARVRIRIEQEATLTRNAFLATLEISNDSSDKTIEGITAEIHVETLTGDPADDKFGVLPPIVTGMSDVSGGGVLGPTSSGRADWTLIPTRDAAPIEPVTYRVRGSFSYTLNGQVVTIPLFPDEITVLPDPVLNVKYFLERRVFSDDPFTPEIEPVVPFSLGILVANSGAGEARNFRVTSSQPKIIENDKGLLIAFAIIGSQVGDQPGSPSLTIDLGTIAPNRTKTARWLMTSSLEGEFISFDATFEHVNPLGIEGLSLIDGVSIHQLTHAIRVDHPADDGSYDFLTDDVVDLQLLPDVIYGSDGTLLPVRAITEGTFSGTIHPPVFEVTLTVEPTQAGWTYVRVDDPAGRPYRLAGVRRPDGTFIRLNDNAWRTRRIVRIQGQPPREEAFLHFVDHVPGAGPRTYTILYEPARGFSPADLNRDGTVDGIDWGLFLSARGHPRGEPGYNPLADYDDDGVVSLVDQQTWLAAYREWLNDPNAPPPPPIVLPTGYTGDLDKDLDVDGDDVAAFIRCRGGPAVKMTDPACAPADLDGDGDVDQSDFGALQRCYSGVGLRPAAECGRKE
jgi:hypothetical protein